MRKLLVASQKSGVGKTTTAINLAAAAARGGARVLLVETDPLNNVSAALNLPAHGSRAPLRTAGIDLPGVLYCDVVPKMDVFSPYEDGGCTDTDLDLVLQLLGLDAFRENYDCVILNAPPFLGGKPGHLLAGCDDYVVVLQAEPMAHRTMPAFMELVQRAVKSEAKPAQFRGYVVTLPQSEDPGGRWEQELRGRYGTRVLPKAVPYDGEVGKANSSNQAVVHSCPEAPAALAYQELSTHLQLGRSTAGATERSAAATLSLAAAAVKEHPLTPRAAVTPAARRSSGRLRRVAVPVPAGVGARSDAPEIPNGTPPKSGPHRRINLPPPRKSDPALPPVCPLLPSTPARPARTAGPVSPSALHDIALPETPPPLHSSPRPYYIWIGLGVAAGVGLRAIELPAFALPMIVGLAVAALVTLFLHLFVQHSAHNRAEESIEAAAPPEEAPQRRTFVAGRRPGRDM